MRYANFEVPSEVITDFVKEMEERGIVAAITGVTENDELILRVGYEREDAESVDELEDKLAELAESVYEEAEDEEYEEDEEDEEDEDEEETDRRRRR